MNHVDLMDTPPGFLERAIAIGCAAHAGQRDKAGAPYILHPLRVMLAQNCDEARMAAVLHDVVEDGEGWTLERLRAEGFSEVVVSAVEAVTRRREEEGDDPETYLAFVRRATAHPIARLIKRADLQDNCDLSRIAHPTELDFRRIDKYRQALSVLDSLDSHAGLGEQT